MFPVKCKPSFSLMAPVVRLELCVFEYLDAYGECVEPVTKVGWMPFLQNSSGFMRYVTWQGNFLRYIIIILGYCWFSRGKHSICLFILSVVCKRWRICFKTTQLIEIGIYFITFWVIFWSTIGCLRLGIIGTPLSFIVTSGSIKNGLSVGQKPDVNE